MLSGLVTIVPSPKATTSERKEHTPKPPSRHRWPVRSRKRNEASGRRNWMIFTECSKRYRPSARRRHPAETRFPPLLVRCGKPEAAPMVQRKRMGGKRNGHGDQSPPAEPAGQPLASHNARARAGILSPLGVGVEPM